MYWSNRLLHKKKLVGKSVLMIIALVLMFTIPLSTAFADDSGPKSPTNFYGVSWVNHSNVAASDNLYASVTLNTSVQATPQFTSKGFNFAIPDGSTINGISVNVERKQSGTGTSFYDEAACLVINDALVLSSNRSTGQTWPTTDTVKTFGSPTDLWGQTLTPAIVNSPSFGFAFWARKISGTKTALVDYISMTVYYTPPAPADTTSPVIAAQSDMIVEATSAAGSVVTFAPTATDNVDPSVTVVCSPASGSQFALGTTQVTCNATDAAGNPATPVTFNVTVRDTTAPVITLTGSDPVSIGVGTPYVEQGATWTDAVDGTGAAIVGGAVNTAVPGTYTLTYNYTDAAGNAATQVTRTVHVLDMQAPVITLLGTSPVTVEGGTSYTDAGATALDNVDGDITASIITNNPVNTGVVGTYTVTYNVTDAAGNHAIEVTRTVNVVDTTAPVIVAQSDMIVEATSAAGAVVTFAPTATDNVDPSVTVVCSPASGSQFALGTTQVTCNSVDAAGNAAAPVTFNVTVRDTTAPVITLTGSDPFNVNQDQPYVEQGATWTDAVDGTGATIVGGDAVNTAVPGTYTVTYNYTDAAGNAALQVTRTVHVLDTQPPVIILNGANPMTVYWNEAYVEPGETAIDNYDGSVSVVIGGNVDTSTLGVYTVTYDATDSSGNHAVQQVRTVQVVKTPPVVATILVSGPSPVMIPRFGLATASYSASVLDQYGDPMMGVPVTWSLLVPKFGVSINASTGVVTVSSFASPGSVTVVAKNGSVTGSKLVSLTVPVRSISLNKSSITLRINRTYTLTATILPSSATDKSVTWSSSDPTIASVDSFGKVTAKRAGIVTIIVTSVDGGKTDTCRVKVTK